MIEVVNNQKNESILLLHGFPEDKHIWDSYRNDLYSKYNLLLLDSKKPPEVESLVLAVLKAIAECNSQHLHIISHDIGGYLATAMYPYLQNETKSLVYISASFPQLLVKKWKQPKQLLKSWYTLFFQIPIASDLAWKHLAPTLIDRFYPEDAKHIKNISAHAAWLSLYRDAFRSLLRPMKEKIHAATLFIDATEDPFLEVNERQDLDAFFTNVSQRVVKGSHWFVTEEASKVTSYILPFMENANGNR